MTEREYGIWSEFAEEELLNNQLEEDEDDEQHQKLDPTDPGGEHE